MTSHYLQDFHKMTIQERIEVLRSLHPELNGSYTEGLDIKTADLMIENCVGKISLPVGLGLYFQVNSKEYIVPMSTEEPSVVAAASAAAKLIKKSGGFKTHSTAPIMTGQIQVLDIDQVAFTSLIQSNANTLIKKANTLYCPRMVERGGGVISIKYFQLTESSGVVEIEVNVGEAMGANIVNSICEGLSVDIQNLSQCRLGLRILSNYCGERRAVSEFKIAFKDLTYKGIPGEELAKRFIESYEFAMLSVNRACTHNKGILNGIIAVCLATGQDTRAIEAAAHSWASRSGRYQPLNSYSIENQHLVGKIEFPIAIGTKGGALRTNPSYQGSLYLLGNPSSSELGQIIASVGLASNFAAIRAMVSEGISKGHMALHAKNIALAAGVPSAIVSEVVEYMKKRGEISQQAATDYLNAHHIHKISRKSFNPTGPLNTFHINLSEASPPISFTIAFNSPRIQGVHIDLDKKSENSQKNIQKKLFGRKSYSWLYSFLKMISEIKFEPLNPRNNKELQVKVKLYNIWINEISIHLIDSWGAANVEQAFQAIFSCDRKALEGLMKDAEDYIEFGVFLVFELYHVLNFNLETFESSPIQNSRVLADEIRKELKAVIEGNIKASITPGLEYPELVNYRKKQMSASLMLLCDCLGEDMVDERLLKELLAVGDTLEIICTVKRDFEKYQKGETGHPNLYKAWEEQRFVKDLDYFEYFGEVIKEKMKRLPGKQRSLAQKAMKLIDGYYNKYPKL